MAQTVMFVGDRRQSWPAGAVADPIKATRPKRSAFAPKASVVMLTGDSRTTARGGRQQLGIDEVEAEVLPDQKEAVVKRLQSAGRVSPWPATASTMRPRSPRPTSASRWAPAPMSRWKAPA